MIFFNKLYNDDNQKLFASFYIVSYFHGNFYHNFYHVFMVFNEYVGFGNQFFRLLFLFTFRNDCLHKKKVWNNSIKTVIYNLIGSSI